MDQEFKVCLMKLGSTSIQHSALQHMVKEHSGVKENNRKEDTRIKSSEIKDLDEVKLIKVNEDTKTVDIEEKDTSFVFSESKFFNEFL